MDRKELKAKAKEQISNYRWLLLFLIMLLCSVISIVCCIICIFIPVVGWVIAFIAAPGVFTLLCTIAVLRVVDTKASPVIGQSFSTGFQGNNIKRSFFASWRLMLFTWLWSLLFVIPGIVKAISYSQMFFLLADDEEMTAAQAQAKSMELMKGHKWEFFKLGLSFLGWAVLAGLTFGLLYIWLTPYIQATLANFYRGLVPAKATKGAGATAAV